MRNFVHERFVTGPLPHPPQLPAVNDDAIGIYYRPTETKGLLLGTGAIEPEQIEPEPEFEFDQLAPEPESLRFILAAAKDRLPLTKTPGSQTTALGWSATPSTSCPTSAQSPPFPASTWAPTSARAASATPPWPAGSWPNTS